MLKDKGPRLCPPSLPCDVPATGPDARAPGGEKQAWRGHPVGTGPCLVNVELESDPQTQSLAGPGGGAASEPNLGRVTGRTLCGDSRRDRLGWACGGPDTRRHMFSSFYIPFRSPLLCSCPSSVLADFNLFPRPGVEGE